MSTDFLTRTREESRYGDLVNMGLTSADHSPPVRALRFRPRRNMLDLTEPHSEKEDVFALTDVSTPLPLPSWFFEMATEVVALTDLPEDWDSYGANPISVKSVNAALNVILRVSRKGLPRPIVFPESAGGVGFEWESPTGDLTVIVRGVSDASFYLDDEHEGSLEDLESLDEQLLNF